MEQPKQINNTSERLVDDLKSRLSTQSRISIAAASFSIYAFEAMKAELEKVEEVRLCHALPSIPYRSGDDDRPAGGAVALGGEKAGPLSDRR